jgi:hypothetical protein
MTRPPRRELLLPYDHEEKFDYDKIGNIVSSLEYLRTEAKKTGCEEIYTLSIPASTCVSPCTTFSSGPAISFPTRTDSFLRRAHAAF